ncbi:hypothetical protein [Paenibacillus sp. SYP-B4298]|uniref:hypothetical protein n=1 Tax=Paenibacillus sp. SYP-B4298 TaxID=2996034 RepID=UPI0022DD88A5|nr:hypothetical protein [Paenibacillus sp. SYP-B4298]
MRKMSPALIVIIVLAAIGLAANLDQYVIPIVVLGAIFLLYKFPPKPLRRNGTQGRPGVSARPRATSSPSHRSKTSRKNIPFRVIEGGKDDNQDDLPKYH